MKYFIKNQYEPLVDRAKEKEQKRQRDRERRERIDAMLLAFQAAPVHEYRQRTEGERLVDKRRRERSKKY